MSTADVTITLPPVLAEAILRDASWTTEAFRGGNAYVRPGHPARRDGGQFGTDYVWTLQDALVDALHDLVAAPA